MFQSAETQFLDQSLHKVVVAHLLFPVLATAAGDLIGLSPPDHNTL